MSILIKGMEMPKTCGECRFSVDGWCYVIASNDDQPGYIKPYEKAKWCPLIEVPEDVQPVKHGRWIQLTQDEGYTALKCSLCGEISCCRGMYCPDCGARMDGE